jgi:hypothetical protein
LVEIVRRTRMKMRDVENYERQWLSPNILCEDSEITYKGGGATERSMAWMSTVTGGGHGDDRVSGARKRRQQERINSDEPGAPTD